MSDFKGKRCDGDKCEQIKKESNHWHEVYRHGDGCLAIGMPPGVIFHQNESAQIPVQLPVFTKLDFCSERCLIGYISRFIGQEQKG